MPKDKIICNIKEKVSVIDKFQFRINLDVIETDGIIMIDKIIALNSLLFLHFISNSLDIVLRIYKK